MSNKTKQALILSQKLRAVLHKRWLIKSENVRLKNRIASLKSTIKALRSRSDSYGGHWHTKYMEAEKEILSLKKELNKAQSVGAHFFTGFTELP